MMWYPLPLRSEFFAYQQTDHQATSRPLQSFRSRVVPPDDMMQSYLSLVTKRQWIRSAIPGVESVYLANSITFNALHEWSNIDFFIVTESKRLWMTKSLVTFVFWCINTRERHTTKAMHFSVDFLVTKDHQDLSCILLSPSDPYLVYRLAHLVPIYHRDFVYYDTIYEENKRIQYYLPNFLARQSIFLWIDISIGSMRIKRCIERILSTVVGDLVEYIVKYISLLIFHRKKKRKNPATAHILIWSWLYKSYDDKRKRYALQRELAKKTHTQAQKEH